MKAFDTRKITPRIFLNDRFQNWSTLFDLIALDFRISLLVSFSTVLTS